MLDFAARFSFRVRIELALVGAERPRPGAPTCGSGGPARPARCRHSHTRGRTVCISKTSTEPGGPEIPPRPSGLARCPHSYTRVSIPRPLEKPPGLGRRGPGSVSKPVPESPALGLLAPASPPAATEEIFAGDSCSGCGGLESVFQARGGALVARTATPGLARLPSSGSGLSRPNPQQSAAEAASPAEKSNSNLRRGDFPHPGPAGVSLAAAAHAGGHPRRRTRDHSARTRAHGRRSRPPVK